VKETIRLLFVNYHCESFVYVLLRNDLRVLDDLFLYLVDSGALRVRGGLLGGAVCAEACLCPLVQLNIHKALVYVDFD